MRTTLLNKCRLISGCFLLVITLTVSKNSIAQKSKVDSLSRLLSSAKEDTSRVKYMWQIARDISLYNPDSALLISQKALYLARKIKYKEGESRSLGILANTFSKIGNYPRALEVYLEKLKLEEKRNNPRNMASVLINIGIVYNLEEEYKTALSYISKADSIIVHYNIDELRFYSALNIGDIFSRMNLPDSSFYYFSKSLEVARTMEDIDLIGTSMTGLGNSFLQKENYDSAEYYYRSGIKYLIEANDDELLCEASLGLANLFQKTKRLDSAAKYGLISLETSRKGFLTKELDAAQFLTEHYKLRKDIDNAFKYVSVVNNLNDSINSRSKIRELQVLSSNEQFRQAELEEKRRIQEEERSQQLQLLLIAIVIPGIFLLTLILSSVIISVKVIRLLGVLSLLFLFEYLTLLLHPTVVRITHHTPVYEILIFVAIAAILIPLHHKLEHWFIHKLLHRRHHSKNLVKENIPEAAPEVKKIVSVENQDNPGKPKR